VIEDLLLGLASRREELQKRTEREDRRVGVRVKDRFASCCCCIDNRSILQSTHDQQAASKPARAAAGRENACARVPIDRDVRATPSDRSHATRERPAWLPMPARVPLAGQRDAALARGNPSAPQRHSDARSDASSITGTRHFTWKPPRAPPTPSSTSRLHIITSRNSRS
jgi:hypothetical protein